MIFSYFLQISNHMWDDEFTPRQPWSVTDPWDPCNRIDVEIFDKIVDFLSERKYNMLVIDVGDGVRLNSHPEIAAPDAWSIDFLRQKLDEIRKKGMEPIPKLNFSNCHNVWQKEWRYRTGLPEHLDFCRDVIREVSEIFDRPRFFHLGLDEETFEHQKGKGIAIIRNEPCFWRDAYALFECVEQCGARPWVFSDYYWHYPEIFEKRMPKSVVQSNWYYGLFNTTASNPNLYRIRTYDRFEELGYDQIPVPSTWDKPLNPLQTMAYCKKVISPEHLLGYNEIPWRTTNRTEFYTHLSDADRFYLGRKAIYPETL